MNHELTKREIKVGRKNGSKGRRNKKGRTRKERIKEGHTIIRIAVENTFEKQGE